MTDEQIKEKIQKVADEKYKGGFRHLRPAYLKTLIGYEGFKRIYEKISPDLHEPYSLATFCFMNDILERPTCPCGKKTRFNTTTKLFLQYCSNKCKWEHNDKIQEVKKKTCLEKYGSINVLASDYGKAKAKETLLLKYGVDNYTKTDVYKAWAIGRPNTPEANEKVRKSHLKKFYESLPLKYPNFVPLFPLEDYDGVKGYKQYKWFCNGCKQEIISSCDNGCSPQCDNCNPKGTTHELVLKDFFDKTPINYVHNCRKTLPSKKEIDIYLPDLNIGIEVCGLHWHSTSGPSYGPLDHITKYDECESIGIRLITLFDDEFYHKQKLLLSRLKSICGLVKRKIYARKCEIVELSADVSTKFLDKYHIQGAIGGSYKYGLTYKSRLVAVMTFNKGRSATGNSNEEGVYELGRYCSISNFSVIGGAGKLFKHFLKTVDPDEVYSYCDKRWNTGKVYENIGMTYVKDTVPNYWYTKDFKSRLHRVRFQKSKLTHMPSYSEDLTEEEIMRREKYFRTWDCGSKLFRYLKNLPSKTKY